MFKSLVSITLTCVILHARYGPELKYVCGGFRVLGKHQHGLCSERINGLAVTEDI